MNIEKRIKQFIAIKQRRDSYDCIIGEMAELTDAIIKDRQGRPSNIDEELADVYCTVLILAQERGISIETLNAEANSKIKRALNAITGSEQYHTSEPPAFMTYKKMKYAIDKIDLSIIKRQYGIHTFLGNDMTDYIRASISYYPNINDYQFFLLTNDKECITINSNGINDTTIKELTTRWNECLRQKKKPNNQ